ncbi:hypothetical protein D5086_031801 [Populus alba]|uniref:Uncharacterized protein n=1 Tax=Populus alba TaxID=43335 RepID=A0ACC4AJK0_POPAL
MALKLVQLQSKAAQASLFVAKLGGSYYRQLLEQNKQCIQVPPTVEKCDLLSKQLFHTRLARQNLTWFLISKSVILPAAIRLHFEGSFTVESTYTVHLDFNFNIIHLTNPSNWVCGTVFLRVRKHLWKNRHELRVEDAGIAAWFGLVRLVVEVSHSLATIGSICLRKDWGAARAWF